jgi:hypothetical protein
MTDRSDWSTSIQHHKRKGMIFNPFLFRLLNNSMATWQRKPNAAQWLQQNGISDKHFADIDVPLLQAQRVAHNAIKHHALLLTSEQRTVLDSYLCAMRCERMRRGITFTQTHKVLNIGSKLNRQIYRRKRHF